MAWIDGDRLKHLEALETTFEGVVARADQLQFEKNELQIAHDGLQSAFRVQSRVEEALAEYEDAITIGGVEDEVTKMLVDEGRVELQKSIAAGLKKEKGQEIMDELRLTEGQAMKASLDDMFQTDGTYDEIRIKVEQEVRREVAADLRADAEAKAREDADAPETKATLIAEIQGELAEDPRLIQHAESYRQERIEEWRQEAMDAAFAEVEHDVLARKVEIIANVQATYAGTRQGGQQLERRRAEATERVKAMALEDLLADSADEAHKEALEERRQIEAQKLVIKNRAEKLALDFTNGGIEIDKIEKDSTLTILLGSIADENVKVQDRHYSDRTEIKPVLRAKRKIVVTKMESGLFRVDYDSLALSKNEYARPNGLAEGVLIKLGILVSETQGDKVERRLLPVLKAGARLQYDNDTSTPEFIDAHLPVADIIIDGTQARKYHELREDYL